MRKFLLAAIAALTLGVGSASAYATGANGFQNWLEKNSHPAYDQYQANWLQDHSRPAYDQYQAGIGTGYQVAWVDHTRAAEPGDYNN